MGADAHRREDHAADLRGPPGLGLARHGLASMHKAQQQALINEALTKEGN
jgi:hypothetical protein